MEQAKLIRSNSYHFVQKKFQNIENDLQIEEREKLNYNEYEWILLNKLKRISE